MYATSSGPRKLGKFTQMNGEAIELHSLPVNGPGGICLERNVKETPQYWRIDGTFDLFPRFAREEVLKNKHFSTLYRHLEKNWTIDIPE